MKDLKIFSRKLHKQRVTALMSPDLPIFELDLSARPYNCLESAGIRTVGDLRNHTEQELLSIRGLGDKSLREIKKVKKKIAKHEVFLPKLRSSPSFYNQVAAEVNWALYRGVISIKEISDIIGRNYYDITSAAKYKNIVLPDGRLMRAPRENSVKRAERIATMSKQGLTLEEIASREAIGREAVRQRVKKLGLTETRKEVKRKKAEEARTAKNSEFYETQTKRIIAGQIVNVMYRRAIEEGNLPWQKAIESYYSRKSTAQEPKDYFDKLVKLFEARYEAEKKGEKLSLDELAKASGILWFPSVGKILSKAGLEPMYGARKKRAIFPEKTISKPYLQSNQGGIL